MTRQSTENRGEAVMQTEVFAFPVIRFSRDLASLFSGMEREKLLQMKISLLNVNVSYKRVASIQFRASPLSSVS